MANSRQSVTIFSPSSKRPTKRTRSSITEHSFQGITPSPRGGSVTHVSGTNCHPCVRPLTDDSIGLTHLNCRNPCRKWPFLDPNGPQSSQLDPNFPRGLVGQNLAPFVEPCSLERLPYKCVCWP